MVYHDPKDRRKRRKACSCFRIKQLSSTSMNGHTLNHGWISLSVKLLGHYAPSCVTKPKHVTSWRFLQFYVTHSSFTGYFLCMHTTQKHLNSLGTKEEHSLPLKVSPHSNHNDLVFPQTQFSVFILDNNCS